MRVAAIDAGTNTLLMLVADLAPGGALGIVADTQDLIRIGEGVRTTRRISEAAIDRLCATLERRVAEARDTWRVERLIAAGTSAFRRATNGKEVVRRVRERTGVTLEILSGEEEAALTYFGAIRGPAALARHLVVLDVGGGSTEIIAGTRDAIRAAQSIDIGVVVLREEFYPTYPPPAEAIAAARAACTRAFQHLDRAPADASVVAVAGTPTTLAALDLGLARHDPARVEGHRLSRGRVAELAGDLHGRTLAAIEALPCVDPLRADVLPAGALVLETLMDSLHVETLGVSTRGVRFGLALRAAEAAGDARR